MTAPTAQFGANTQPSRAEASKVLNLNPQLHELGDSTYLSDLQTNPNRLFDYQTFWPDWDSLDHTSSDPLPDLWK